LLEALFAIVHCMLYLLHTLLLLTIMCICVFACVLFFYYRDDLLQYSLNEIDMKLKGLKKEESMFADLMHRALVSLCGIINIFKTLIKRSSNALSY